jgi:hypothetical protein
MIRSAYEHDKDHISISHFIPNAHMVHYAAYHASSDEDKKRIIQEKEKKYSEHMRLSGVPENEVFTLRAIKAHLF